MAITSITTVHDGSDKDNTLHGDNLAVRHGTPSLAAVHFNMGESSIPLDPPTFERPESSDIIEGSSKGHLSIENHEDTQHSILEAQLGAYVDPSELLLKMVVERNEQVHTSAEIEPGQHNAAFRALRRSKACASLSGDAPKSPQAISALDRARQLTLTGEPSEVARLYLKAIYETVAQGHSSNDEWNECLTNLSALLRHPTLNKRETRIMMNSEFKLMETQSLQPASAFLIKQSFPDRLRCVWKTFEDHSPSGRCRWSEPANDVAEWIIQAFSKARRWRARLELAKVLSAEASDKDGQGEHQLLLSLCESLIQWKGLCDEQDHACREHIAKIFSEQAIVKYLTKVLPRLDILHKGPAAALHPWRPTYLIASLACHCFSKGGLGQRPSKQIQEIPR
ncbi:uncharacterized protein LY89DRAFT_206162 [Mollisia scopiformis]|uniref:Uncharacterized protein n=1 Tax=Mollisia scopiformis TaxID=149040 RepID=A0A194WWN2_MOLSC|nr:uncharacterized protein LY89DRAFT_206162 [Mollisia scopiformis]KUJ12355.1 hypothetical protein LY89DRAFT_206162 [Mollisia scopiformis]